MPGSSPKAQLASFLAKFTPDVARQARAALAEMRRRLPGALELVYDNYNALAIGFGPTEKVSHVLFSIAVFPRWVTLVFFRGKGLPDPKGLLKGDGSQVRHIRLDEPGTLASPAVRALMKEAVRRADPPLDPSQGHRLIIKSVSAKQRPRRPAPAKKGMPANQPG